MTIHSLLGLKQQINDRTGEQYFVQDSSKPSRIKEFDLVVIDEASMIPKQIFDLLAVETSDMFSRLQVLFVGDDGQLPPVNERISKVFLHVDRVSILTEVMRYGGQIALLAKEIKEKKVLPQVETTIDSDGNGIYCFTTEKWHMEMLRAFESPKYRLDPDYCKALAYRNNRVNALNTMIRNVLYGRNANEFVVGERIRMKEAYSPGRSVLLQNSQKCEVVEAVEGRIGDYCVWFLSLKTDDGIQVAPVIKAESIALFESRQKQLAKEKQWRKWWGAKQQFAWVGYNYAGTVHSGQGSTYQNVFVDVVDIVSCPKNRLERPNLLYTACTRASKRLLLMQ